MNLREDGITLLHGLVEGELLARMQYDAKRYLASRKQGWLSGIECGTQAPTFLDIEADGLRSRSFVKFIRDTPEIASNYVKAQCEVDSASLRLTTPSPFSYVQWHSDHVGPACTQFKLLLYLSDVLPNGGEFCYVPTSHTLSHDDKYVNVGLELAQSMGYRRYPGGAGSALLFDTRGIHGVMKNSSRRPRIALILSLQIVNSARRKMNRRVYARRKLAG